MREYFRLLGVNCSKKLRKNLDTSFYLTDNPNNLRYALFRKKEDGDCPLRLKNGLCGLQKECGESVLPAICRYYPRAIRAEFAYECSCSGSCEKVVEMLLARQDKIRLEEAVLSFDFEGSLALINNDEKRELYTKIRKTCLDILQNRDYRLPTRLRQIGTYMQALQIGKLNCEDFNYKEIFLPENVDLSKEFEIIKKTFLWFEENSVSLGEYAAVVEGVFSEGITAYSKARKNFESLYPAWETMLENLMINHIFYDRFPFANYYKDYKEGFFSLCGAYTFLRYMAIGYTYMYPSIDCLTDVLAAVLRVVEHSSFDKNVAIMLKCEGITNLEGLGRILEI